MLAIIIVLTMFYPGYYQLGDPVAGIHHILRGDSSLPVYWPGIRGAPATLGTGVSFHQIFPGKVGNF